MNKTKTLIKKSSVCTQIEWKTIKRLHEHEECKDIIKINRKNIVCFAYQQDKVFKNFKDNRKFKSLAEQFKITKSTIIFKINIVKLIDTYPKMMTSSITLNFLKSYYKDIKNICKENQ